MKSAKQMVSPLWGFAAAARLWRLVLAVWLVPLLLMLPAYLIARSGLAAALGSVPVDRAASADVPLIVIQALSRFGPSLAVAVLVAVPLLWAWMVLWTAGAVGWQVWATGRPVRLGEILGYGMLRWWRYARLSITAFVALLVLVGGACAPFFLAAAAAKKRLQEVRMVNLQLAGLALGGVLLWILWSATVRGAWELARPERRSAALAWWRGLSGTFREPVRSLGTILLWATVGKILTLAPAVLDLRFSALRGSPGGVLLGLVLVLGAAFCWVALLLSFAPVSGLVLPAAEEQEEGVAGRASA